MGIRALTVRLLLSTALAAGAHGEDRSPEFKNAQAKTHYQQALQYGDKGLWAPAVLELNRARELEPGNPDILLQLGIAHGERKEWNQALGFLRKAAAIAPTSVEAHYNLALTLDRANPGRRAGTPEYRKALNLNPRHVDSLVNLAIAVGDQNAAEAKSLFNRVIRIDPKNSNAHLNLGLLLQKESEESASVAEFRQAIQLDPHLLEARRRLATILMSQRQWDQVIEQCQGS